MHWGIRTSFCVWIYNFESIEHYWITYSCKICSSFGYLSRAKDRKLAEYIKWDFN